MPEPVGPVTRIIPKGLDPSSRTRARASGSSISLSSPSWVAPLSSRRRQTFSPKRLGRVLTRKSITRSRYLRRMRPSWAWRRSAMSRSARILKRDVTAGTRRLGSGSTYCWSTPSWRKRRRNPFCCGSTWMSLAPTDIACSRIRSTSVTTGEASASLRLASRSRASRASWASLSSSLSSTSSGLKSWRKDSAFRSRVLAVSAGAGLLDCSAAGGFGFVVGWSVSVAKARCRSASMAGCRRIVRCWSGS